MQRLTATQRKLTIKISSKFALNRRSEQSHFLLGVWAGPTFGLADRARWGGRGPQQGLLAGVLEPPAGGTLWVAGSPFKPITPLPGLTHQDVHKSTAPQGYKPIKYPYIPRVTDIKLRYIAGKPTKPYHKAGTSQAVPVKTKDSDYKVDNIKIGKKPVTNRYIDQTKYIYLKTMPFCVIYCNTIWNNKNKENKSKRLALHFFVDSLRLGSQYVERSCDGV